MSKFFFEQLARILIEQVNKGDFDRGYFVPIITKLNVLRSQDIISFEIVHLAFEGLVFPIDGLDKAYACTRN